MVDPIRTLDYILVNITHYCHKNKIFPTILGTL